jgi:tRNA threonylcarbamoyladenosine biosynthesis protein TsaE
MGEFAGRLAGKLGAGDLLLLEGSLGAGKTTFVQGLARGLGSEVGASSPTFVLERRYPGRLELIHLDFYRLDEEREATMLVAEALSEPEAVVAVEWADKFPAASSGREFLRIKFEEIGEERRIALETKGPRAEQLMESLK